MDPVRRILLVEDEPDIRSSLKELIEMQIPGAAVSVAATGPEGLLVLAAEPPHLIITDYKMPGMSGLEFLAAARKVSPGTPSVLMTAYPDIEVATRAINDAHIENFFAKPIEPDEFLEMIVRIFQAHDAKLEKERALARTFRDVSTSMTGK